MMARCGFCNASVSDVENHACPQVIRQAKIPAFSGGNSEIWNCLHCSENIKDCRCFWAAIRELQTFREETTGKLNELFKMTGEGLSDLDKRIESIEQSSTAPYPYDEEYKAIVTLAANYKAQLAIALKERDEQKSNSEFWYNTSTNRLKALEEKTNEWKAARLNAEYYFKLWEENKPSAKVSRPCT